jgi:hypothetical protein
VRVSPYTVDGISELDHCIFGKVINQYLVDIGLTRADPIINA